MHASLQQIMHIQTLCAFFARFKEEKQNKIPLRDQLVSSLNCERQCYSILNLLKDRDSRLNSSLAYLKSRFCSKVSLEMGKK